MLASSGAPFTSSPPLPAHAHTHAYAPTRPSPLSPRSANARFPRLFSRRMASDLQRSPPSAARADALTTSSSSEREPRPLQAPAFHARDPRATPVARRMKQTPDEARERRRAMFMRKVERGRAEKAWAGHSEFILRSDFLSEQRRWEAERRREAPWMGEEELEEGDDDMRDMAGMGDGSGPSRRRAEDDVSTWEVEEVARREEEELRELIALQERRGRDSHTISEAFEGEDAASARQVAGGRSAGSSPTRYGSDEEEYEEIFRDLLSSPGVRGSFEAREDAEMMDWN